MKASCASVTEDRMPCPRCQMHVEMSVSRRAEIDQLERVAHAERKYECFDEAPEWQREEAHDDVSRALNFTDARLAGLSLETFNKIRDAAAALGIDVAR